MSWFGGASQFNTLLEKATSTKLLEPDWTIILEMCDSLRSGDSDPKAALSAVKKKLASKNPNVTLLALHCLESMVKNCGHPIHKEVATQAFMDDLKEICKATPSGPVRDKVLELIQTWAHAFRKEPAYRAVQDTMTIMRAAEGVKFPQLKESDAMFSAQVPPEWEDANCCHLCRAQFSTFNRKHHCRKCGQVFCGKCSSQTAALPKLGIEKKVRVCDTCFLEVCQDERSVHLSSVLRGPMSTMQGPTVRSPTRASGQGAATTVEQQTVAAKESKLKEAQLREEEELQLALALSRSEAEYHNQRGTTRPTTVQDDTNSRTVDDRKESETPTAGHWANNHNNSTSSTYPTELVEANAPTRSECGSTTGSTESELTHYFDRKYWDERSHRQGENDTPKHSSKPLEGALPTPTVQLVGADAGDNFEQMLEKTLDTFEVRLRSNVMRGRPVANDSYVQSLFVQISSLHARLLQCVQETDDQRAYYESLQDKLQQIWDARAALDALREENREEERKRQEEAERARQMQMAHKLEIMRQRKHEYLQYQHQLAMSKIQEQEMAYRAVGAPPPSLPPGTMAIPPSTAPGQPPVYAPQPQYPPGMLPPGQQLPGPSQQVMPPPALQQYGSQPPVSPPHNAVQSPVSTEPIPLPGPHGVTAVTSFYGPAPSSTVPPVPTTAAPALAVAAATGQHQTPMQTVQHQQPTSSALGPGQGQPAFEPYSVVHTISQLPAPPQTPLPQPCAPPQTPTPTPMQQQLAQQPPPIQSPQQGPPQELNLPSVPTHEPGGDRRPVKHHPQPAEEQLISFD
ncbi:hepatocyte growth factor-regulated tyrosine kinase substrate-like isoform X2 [Varroa destructor]|uniref:Hepatocyte growth factor-regulated tyrosine kinase substrate n=1 Tax=Varroa destructor TaxID=109461 RepID=A0A7M7MB35_VARDE|nr:hepatocyte growth factor-regulated tyrosine kinase substrate-like isoform X2 [Varroa destructor]